MKLIWAVSALLVTSTSAITTANLFAQGLPANDVAPATATAVDPPASPVVSDTTPLYVRPTQRQKLRTFAFDAFGPYAFISAFAGGGIEQAYNSPPEWGQGFDSYGVRAASSYGIELITVTSHYGLAELLREDPIYYPCGCKGLLPRIGHALISTITARRGIDGHTTLSISGIVSPYAGTMAALAWYPDRYGVKDGFRMGNYNLATQAAWNLGFEFIYGGPHALFGRNRALPGSGQANPSGSSR